MIKPVFRSLILSSLISLSMQIANCTDGTTACGPGSACCPAGEHCNTNRGIPFCEDLQQPVLTNFLGKPCADPYLNDCPSLLGISGLCCPIGTICFNNGLDQRVACIDAYGTTSAAFPSATQGFIPPATFVANNDADISFNPSASWNKTDSPNCTPSNETLGVRITNSINASLSFSYIGPSIMINTITSPQGGVFAVIVDGFNTTDVIDTFSGPNQTLPVCYPLQYPPFLKPPPTLATQNNHTIQLLYIGPSPNAPSSTTESTGQFGWFEIPTFQIDNSAQRNTAAMTKARAPLLMAPFLLVLTLPFI